MQIRKVGCTCFGDGHIGTTHPSALTIICIEQVQAQLHVSERRACAAPGQHRSTQRKVPRGREDEERLTADIIELARQYGRYGYRKIAALRASRPRSYQNLMTA